jgi:hypothetical protein
VGRLPQAGEGSEPHRAKKLVVPVLLHDELGMVAKLSRLFG